MTTTTQILYWANTTAIDVERAVARGDVAYLTEMARMALAFRDQAEGWRFRAREAEGMLETMDSDVRCAQEDAADATNKFERTAAMMFKMEENADALHAASMRGIW